MKWLRIEIEFLKILEEIQLENKSLEEWKAIESSDRFQSENYCGGFDGTENKFTFSYYEGKKEFWFEITLAEVDEMVNGEITTLQLSPAR